MPDIDHISPVLLAHVPQGGRTITDGPTRKRTMEAGAKVAGMGNVTTNVCQLGDASCALLHTLNSMQQTHGFHLDPRIIEPASNSTLGHQSASIFASRLLSRN